MAETATRSMTTSSSFRLGLIVRGDTGGLAAQTYDFYKHMNPTKVMLINLDVYTGQHTDESKYPGATIVRNYPTTIEWDAWLHDLDLVFTVECPYDHELYRMARERGIKTVEQSNFEFQQFHQQPELPKPDLILAPSTWRMDEQERFVPVKYLHVPVDRTRFPFTAKREAKKFLHIAGHKTYNDRNGTITVLEALPLIQSDVEIVIRTQDELPRPYTDHKLTIIRDDVADNRDLYNNEDILLLPRRYGGLSLQLNEALSLGMPVLMPNIAPQNEFLPNAWLLPATLKEKTMVKTMIDVYDVKPEDLAKKIDSLAGTDITEWSIAANNLASVRRWSVMKPQYEELFEELCRS
jgi:hypothetical protein